MFSTYLLIFILHLGRRDYSRRSIPEQDAEECGSLQIGALTLTILITDSLRETQNINTAILA